MSLAGLENHVSQDSLKLPELSQVGKRNFVLGSTGAGVMLLKDHWKLCKYKNGVRTLHNIIEDPLEQNNIYHNPDLLQWHYSSREQIRNCGHSK